LKVFPYRDYAHYVAAQTETNRRKLDTVWVSEQSIAAIVDYHGEARSVLCHGTRNGAEQKIFCRAYPDAVVLGTEIADTGEQFPLTVRWDMQEVRIEWVGRFDIVYSNAIDHVIYPEQTVRTWLRQLSTDGCLYIDHANSHQSNYSSESDPLEISDEEMEVLITGCGGEIVQTMEGIGAGYVPTRIYAVRCA
jgi:hypothetical protein